MKKGDSLNKVLFICSVTKEKVCLYLTGLLMRNCDLNPWSSGLLEFSSSLDEGKDERLLAKELNPELKFLATRVRFLRKLKRFFGFV